jgi:hypothetical protein
MNTVAPMPVQDLVMKKEEGRKSKRKRRKETSEIQIYICKHHWAELEKFLPFNVSTRRPQGGWFGLFHTGFKDVVVIRLSR